jgi:hypothetical protein
VNIYELRCRVAADRGQSCRAAQYRHIKPHRRRISVLDRDAARGHHPLVLGAHDVHAGRPR